MIKGYLILTTLLMVSHLQKGYTQVKFEKGYFINNNDEKVECFINNFDWYYNPSEFFYKISNEASSTKIELSNVKEFKVGNRKYVRASVKLDKSSDDVRKLDYDKNPKWSDELLFLNVIMEGNANLYSYRNKDVLRFFFSVSGSPIEQLIHKLYLVDNSEANSNNAFWNQLKNQVNCKSLAPSKIMEVKYSQKSLIKYFEEHNLCVGGGSVLTESNEVGGSSKSFRIRVTAGMDKSQLRLIPNSSNGSVLQLNQEFSPRAGFEFETILPFNKNKWSVFLEPTYQVYSSDLKYKTRYSSLEIPIGLRHGFYLKNDSKIFINVSLVIDLPLKYEVKLSNNTMLIGNKPAVSGAAGLGYSYRRLSIEARYYMDRSALDESSTYFLTFNKLTGIIGYRLY